MGKIIVKALIMVGIAVGISNYLMYLSTGKTPFSSGMPDLSFDAPSLGNGSTKKQQAYKWTDEKGVVHYSSEAPPEMAQAEILEVDPNANLIQGVEIPTKEAPKAAAAQPSMPKGNIYNPKTIKKLFDDAKGVQETLNKRYENLEDPK